MNRSIATFLVSLTLFAAVNALSYYLRSSPADMNDGFRRFGFPLLVLEEGGIAGVHYYSHLALWTNIAIAILISTLAAVFFRRH